MEKTTITIFFCKKNIKFNNKNLPTKPPSGGIPDIDKNNNNTVIDKKICLLKNLRLFSVFNFLKSNINNKLKNKNNKQTYIIIFK